MFSLCLVLALAASVLSESVSSPTFGCFPHCLFDGNPLKVRVFSREPLPLRPRSCFVMIPQAAGLTKAPAACRLVPHGAGLGGRSSPFVDTLPQLEGCGTETERRDSPFLECCWWFSEETFPARITTSETLGWNSQKAPDSSRKYFRRLTSGLFGSGQSRTEQHDPRTEPALFYGFIGGTGRGEPPFGVLTQEKRFESSSCWFFGSSPFSS